MAKSNNISQIGPFSGLKDYLYQIPNFLTLFLVPIILLSIGPAYIEVASDFNTTPENINLIISFALAGIAVGQLTSTFYNRKIKRAYIILTAYFLLTAINIVLFFAENLVAFIILSIFNGYLIGINYVQSTENILSCNIKNKDRLFILMVSFYPMGALIAPLISSTLIKNGISWRYTYLIITVLIFITAIIYSAVSLKGQYRLTAAETKKFKFREIFTDRQKNILFIITLLIVSIYVVAETIFATWTPTYLRLEKGFDIQSAALSITVLQVFIIVGRFISSMIAGKVKYTTVMIIISVVAFISIILFVLFSSQLYIYITLAFVGLGFSAMYPLLVSSGSKIYQKGQGFIVSLVYASAYLGRTAAPFITKSIAPYSLDFSILVSLIFSGVSTILIVLLIIYEKYRIKIQS